MSLITVLIAAIFLFSLGESKVFDQCEFADALRGFGFPENEISTWTCIANYESHFDTTAVNSDTGDYGILQISHIYWCSNSGTPGNGCNSVCSDYLNDDISDDAECARKIFNEHQEISGNGFNAWVTYSAYCNGDNSQWAC